MQLERDISNLFGPTRHLFISRAYSLLAIAGTMLFLGIFYEEQESWPNGLVLFFIIPILMGASLLLSYLPAFTQKARIRLLEVHYYLFPVGNLVIGDLNDWASIFLFSNIVSVMLTYLAIRNIYGLLILSPLILVISGVLLWTGPEPQGLNALPAFILFSIIVISSSLVSWQQQAVQKVRITGEQALKESQELITGLLESTNDLIWAINRKQEIITANESFLHQTNKILGAPLMGGDRFPIEKYQEEYKRAFDGISERFTTTLSDGSTIEVTLNPIIRENEIVAVSGFGRNISQTILLQQNIAKAKERFENATAGANDGIWEWDLQAHEVYLSDRGKEMLGYHKEELEFSQEAFAQLLHPEDSVRVLKIFKEHIKSGNTMLSDEFRMLRKDGSWGWYGGRGRAVRNEQGWVLRISGSITDITQRKQAELDFKKLSLVASHTSNAVVITDALGRTEWVNEGFTRISGYSPEEVIGKLPGSLLQGPDTSPETKAYIKRMLEDRQALNTEILNYHKNGTPYWISMEITPILDEEGNVLNFVAIESDISAQKLNEEQLREAKVEAEQGAKAKSEFLATMSHEIRTPMNAVIGMTGLLLDTPLSEEQRDFVETIRISGDNLLTIINDILDFSKIDAGHLELEQQEFSLAETIEDVLDLMSSKAMAKGLELTYEAASNVPTQIVSDPTRLNQILLNLIGNAIKFTSEGEISLTVKEVRRLGKVSQIQFSVRDTGIGIPEEKLNRLFQPFSQVDASTTRKYGGTGLGLAISAKLVKLMGGDIWVESEQDKGSIFHFTLRVVSNSDSTFGTYVSTIPQASLQNCRALIVDDNHTNLRILKTQLHAWGITTTAFDNPIKALESAESGQYDLMILDMHMPELDGFSLAAEIHQKLSEQMPPLIMLTSLGQSVTRSEKDLFAAFLHKPIRRDQLYKHIHRILKPSEVTAKATVEAQVINYTQDMPKISILIAEDNLVNQKVARRMLQKLGYEPEIVANGQEAVEILERRHFDLIFMDMRMPVMDGLEATRQIRINYHDKGPIICAMTANAMVGDREVCLDAGMNDYITKPVKLESIREAIFRNFPPTPIQQKQTA